MNLSLLLLGGLFAVVVAAPPQRVHVQQPAASQHQEPNTNNQNQHATPQDDGQKPMYEFAYSKYLEEVVKILESEPKFSEKLRGMPEADIKSGKIADHIDDLESHVFDKLTKAKLDELERLREQIQKQIEADGGAHNVKIPDHLDATNWERFGKEDLRKLIRRTVEDMEQIDLERQKKFKEYEMRKKAEEDHKLAQMNEEERRKAIHDAEEAKKRHDEHEKLKHPGSRDQLEEVWEDTDHSNMDCSTSLGYATKSIFPQYRRSLSAKEELAYDYLPVLLLQMDKDNFDPRTFFALHDLNGDGFWNADELEALFQKELDKVYNETDPDDDPRERMEEMYRMREHVTKQMDKNGDRLISLDEFLQDTEAQTPNKDSGWKDIGDEQPYTDEELQNFEREYAKQQGWGDHAYDITTLAPPSTAPQAQPVHHQPVQNAQQQVYTGGQAQPQAANPHAQPVYQQQAQPAHQQVPIKHEPIVEKAKDPAYGI